jgi:DNA replication ATP-dependent helicase Dna2
MAKKKYQLQFLTNNEYVDERTGSIIDRKLNVAMTRARKRLIMVGNAPLLQADYTFGRLIDFCKERDAYYESD